MQHLLLQKSKRYSDPQTISVSNDYVFDSKKGYWVDKCGDFPMMKGPNPPISTSKKCDRETGEDQKGE